MADVTVRNLTSYDTSNVGAVICRTPITLPPSEVDGFEVDNSCVLLTSVDQLLHYFGDPFIDPPEYADLLLVYDLVRYGLPVYVSSVYDMKDNDDGFDIVAYNGYTEFMYVDSSGHDAIGYTLKSNIKFCQPVIQYEIVRNRLRLYISLYFMNRQLHQDAYTLSKFDKTRLYKTIEIVFDNNKVTDKDIISAFSEHGLELHLINNDPDDSKSFVKELNRHKKLVLSFESDELIDRVPGKVKCKEYWYDVHSNNYSYNLSDDVIINNAYKNAIESITHQGLKPHLLCLGKLCKSQNYLDNDNNITKSLITDADPENYIATQQLLMNYFDEEGDTYLFISTPDLPLSTTLDLLNSEGKFTTLYTSLPEQYNCDIYYGYAGDFIDRSLSYDNPLKVFYSAAILSFYNVMVTGTPYMTNSIGGLNISNGSVKIVITESSADKLVNSRCNAVVLFDNGYPSIHGDRSLSLLPNLRYSHISRNFIRIRRLIKEYLETKKFILNTMFNVKMCIDYVKSDILDEFKTNGIISDYSIDYSIEFQTVKISIILIFSQVAESISLDFVI